MKESDMEAPRISFNTKFWLTIAVLCGVAALTFGSVVWYIATH
jgi:hypothetical protein